MIENNCRSCQRDGTSVELMMEVETRPMVIAHGQPAFIRTIQSIHYIPGTTESITSGFCPNCGLTYSTLVLGR